MTNTDTSKVTVILPNFNHANFLPRSISGIRSQTHIDFQAFIIDDASTDDSVKVIKSLIENDARFVLVPLKSNIGIVGVMNLALQLIKSEYVNFAAADDLMLPNLIEENLSFLEKNPHLAFSSLRVLIPTEHNQYIFKSRPLGVSKKDKILITPENCYRVYKKNDFLFNTGASLIRTEALLKQGEFNEELGPFADSVMLKILSIKRGAGLLQDPGLVWFRSQEGFSSAALRNQVLFDEKLRLTRKTLEQEVPLLDSRKFINRLKFVSLYRHESKKLTPNRFHATLAQKAVSGFRLALNFLKYRPFSLRISLKMLTDIRSFVELDANQVGTQSQVFKK